MEHLVFVPAKVPENKSEKYDRESIKSFRKTTPPEFKEL